MKKYLFLILLAFTGSRVVAQNNREAEMNLFVDSLIGPLFVFFYSFLELFYVDQNVHYLKERQFFQTDLFKISQLI